MAEPIAAVQTAVAPDFSHHADAATSNEAAAFANAISQSAPAEHVSAALPASALGGIAAELAKEANAFTNHVQSASKGLDVAKPGLDQPQTGAGKADMPGMKASMDQSIASMHNAYMFAIETTLASKGSTETTKIFNTLLKGQ